MSTLETPQPIIAVCGKGGVGKTVLSALLSRTLIDLGIQPLLLVDADPAGGLVSVIGERSAKTLGQVRDEIIAAARGASKEGKVELAEQVDYLLLEALTERADYSLLSMGHSSKKGCYCPVNRLLREAIDLIASQFSAIVIDAEAGLEQINRQVTQRVSQVIVVVDGSIRSLETLEMISQLAPDFHIAVVANRVSELEKVQLPQNMKLVGTIPEDALLRRFDREGTSLWKLPSANPAVVAVREIVHTLGLWNNNSLINKALPVLENMEIS
ncbi:AAA family ATPase [Deltaproteobacteria bacterium TL4]